MAQPIQGVLFDNDGTLVDTYDLLLESFRYATRTVLGRDVPEADLMRGVGKPLATQMFDFTDDPAVAEELLSTYRAYNHEIHDQKISVFAGVPEMLAELKAAGLALGVVTSKLHWLCERGLEVCGVLEYFDFIIGPDDWPEHKPAPGPILRGCELMGLAPAACAYVGDSPYDMQAANAAGVLSVAAVWGMFDRAVLDAENPQVICLSPADLPAVFAVADR